MLQYRLCRLYGLVKLRLYKAAAEDVDTLGNLDDSVYTYEHYATYYPNKKGACSRPGRTDTERPLRNDGTILVACTAGRATGLPR